MHDVMMRLEELLNKKEAYARYFKMNVPEQVKDRRKRENMG